MGDVLKPEGKMTRHRPDTSGQKASRAHAPRWKMGIWPLASILLIFAFVAAPTFWFFNRGDQSQTQGQAQAQIQSRGTPSPAPPSQRTGRITSMTTSTSGTTTVVTIRFDRALDYRLFTLAQPSPRLVLDMPKVNFAVGNNRDGIVRGEGAVSRLRFAQKSETESRIVVDLNGPVRIVKQGFVGVLGGRALKIELAPTTLQAFAQSAPPPKTSVVSTTLPVPAPLKQGQAGRRFVIVIDPGHGGRDPGALTPDGTLQEKQVTLASALVLRDILKRDRRFEVVLTRETDVFLALERRITIARDRRADLFISLHADAAPPTARVFGATVYTLSEEGGQRARKLLNNENWTIAPSNRSQDPSVTDILRDLTQRDTKNQSAIFGQLLIQQIQRVGPVTGTSHRRASFFVLLSPRVPAVLLEMGFLTTADDAARLGDPAFRNRQMASAARAISEYFDRVQLVSGASRSQ